KQGDIAFSKEKIANQAMSWINNQFIFTSEPLASVFDEMARRYDVKIIMEKPYKENYTGNFSTNIPVEQALSIVCKPFGLTFTKQEERMYVIKK
ncbi:MAG: iron dicitrate transport regulator FecR, partial [Bacteroidetes bacterium]